MTHFKECDCEKPMPNASGQVCKVCNGYIDPGPISKENLHHSKFLGVPPDIKDRMKEVDDYISSGEAFKPGNGTFQWDEEPISIPSNIVENDIRLVELPVRVIFNWSDKIVADYDEETGVTEYKSGWVMTPLPDKHVYNNEDTLFYANAKPEK